MSSRPAPWYPRFARVDRFPSSSSALSALCQLEQIGVEAEEIRLVLEGRRRQPSPPVLEQHPEPGDPVRHGVEVTLRLAEDSLLDRFPERAFVSLPGREGRDQLAAARMLFAPFDKARLLALARLRHWNAVFSGAHGSAAYESFLYQVLGLPEQLLAAARRVFDADQLRAWLRILPLLPRFAGNLPAAAEILAWFLGDPVTAGTDDAHREPIPPEQQLVLARGAAGTGRGVGGFAAGRSRGTPGATGAASMTGAGGAAAAGAPTRSGGPATRPTGPAPRPAGLPTRAAGAAARSAGRAPLGQGFAGSETSEIGTGVFFSIGPLAPERGGRYAGLPFTALPSGRTGEAAHQVSVDLGFAGDLEALYDFWATSRPELFTSCWPQIAHILVHLVPAHMVVQARLQPDAGSGWLLGRRAEAGATLDPGAAPGPGATLDPGAAPGPGATLDPGLHPSTLGAWTVLAGRQQG